MGRVAGRVPNGTAEVVRSRGFPDRPRSLPPRALVPLVAAFGPPKTTLAGILTRKALPLGRPPTRETRYGIRERVTPRSVGLSRTSGPILYPSDGELGKVGLVPRQGRREG